MEKMRSLGYDCHAEMETVSALDVALLFKKSFYREHAHTGIKMLKLKKNPGWKHIQRRLNSC